MINYYIDFELSRSGELTNWWPVLSCIYLLFVKLCVLSNYLRKFNLSVIAWPGKLPQINLSLWLTMNNLSLQQWWYLLSSFFVLTLLSNHLVFVKIAPTSLRKSPTWCFCDPWPLCGLFEESFNPVAIFACCREVLNRIL